MRAVVVLPTPRTPVRIQACGMRPELEGVRDGAHHGVLADQVVEARRAVFARQHAIAGFRRRVAEIEAGGFRGFAHRAIRLAAAIRLRLAIAENGWEADERPDPCSLGLLPSGPDPVGEWLVHRQPPGTYIGPKGAESKQRVHRHPGARAQRAEPGIHSRPTAAMDSDSRAIGCAGNDVDKFARVLHKIESNLVPPPATRADTVPVGDLALARVLLANDANYPWLILVPRRPGMVELIDLDENAQVQLLGEIAAAARALKSITECDKLNIAALGNQVAQLHVHVIARRHSDAAWPKPVWGAAPASAYNDGRTRETVDGAASAARRRPLSRRAWCKVYCFSSTRSDFSSWLISRLSAARLSLLR